MTQRMLALTLIAYLFLVLGYLNIARLNYAPDEPWHYLYVRHLADGKGLPTAETTHQAQHPPLYYAIGAVWVRLARLFLGEQPPQTAFADGIQYTYFAGEEYALRFLSALFGVGAILTVYALACRVAPGDPWVQCVAPALLAFTPLFTYMTSVVNNDALLVLLVAVLLSQTAAYLQTGDERRLAAAGLALG
ncbi:MAG: glycosyltransferase family 39 protein, partial [Armatimonadota bacterium]|nr:glycosyltransferase family 39 protein [Armatimonadota bacterium]